MKKKMFSIAVLMFLMIALSGAYVEIGDGYTASNYIPVHGYYEYSWSRTIYPQTDLNNALDINALGYSLGIPVNNYTMTNQSYYMRHTTDSNFESAEYVDPTLDDSYQLVYQGDVTYNGEGWQDISFNTIFEYNGTDNLEILVINSHGGWTSDYPRFIGTNEIPERAVCDYSDGSVPTGTGQTSMVYPNTRFYYALEGQPAMATITAPLNNSTNVQLPVDLTWTNGADTDWVNLYFSENYADVFEMESTALVSSSYAQESYTISEGADLTSYYWRVVSGNSLTEFLTPTPVHSFTTEPGEGSVIIGNGTLENVPLPMDASYSYSISQSIYTQEQINVANQRIEKIAYYFNGNSAWDEEIQLFMGHSTLSSFSSSSSWVSADELILVYDGLISVPAEAGWVDIQLDLPFNYNNSDNLIIAFAANSPGYHGWSDVFYNTDTNMSMSIYFQSDYTNSDFVSPPSGSLVNAIPNILLSMGDASTTPQLRVTPSSYSWENTLINTVTPPVTFTMRNLGLNPLTVNSMSIDQELDFILTDNNSYPLSITSDAYTFTVEFNPQSVGEFTATITVNDATNGETEISLTGTGYDAMIYDFPHFEGFEEIDSGSLPAEWRSKVLSTNVYSTVGASATTSSEGTQSLRLYNSGDITPELYAFTPPIEDLTAKRIRFKAKSSVNANTLIVGLSESNVNVDNITEIQTITLSTEFEEYFVNLNIDNSESQFIVFKSGTYSGTYQHIYVDEFYIEDLTEETITLITPLVYDYPETMLNTSFGANFTIRNIGVGILTINSVALDSDVGFILDDNNEYPLEITNQTASIQVLFHPLTEGEFTNNLIITDSEDIETVIPLTGSGYDAMVYDFPYLEGFEDIDSGSMPIDWTGYVNSVSTSAVVEVSQTNPYEGINSLKLYNATDLGATLVAITPPINDLTNKRIKFRAKSSTTGSGVIIGTAVNNSGNIQFTARDTLMLTSTYEHYEHPFADADENAQFIALKYLQTGSTYRSVFVDNFLIEDIPTTPVISVVQSSLDFGDVYLNRAGLALLSIENWGTEDLIVDFSTTDTELSFTPEELTIIPLGSINVAVHLNPENEGNYTGSFIVNSNDTNQPEIEINVTGFVLPALPDGITIIGTGSLTNQGLPLDPYVKSSWSQTIYHSEEIGVSNQRIEKISWHYNGNSAWGPDNLKIYMGLTDKTQFDTLDDWIEVDQMMEVYSSTISVPNEAGFVEIQLNTPFVYNDTQNLVVGVLRLEDSWHSVHDEFYCSVSNVARSILFTSYTEAPDLLDLPQAHFLRNSYPNVKMEFEGVPETPELTVFPSNYVYEMVPIDGVSIEKVFTLRSIGLQDIVIAEAPVITGNHANQFSISTDTNTYPLVLPFNDLATISVSFTPSSEGLKTATVEIVDNATRETHTIALNGYAYDDDDNDEAVNATLLSLPVEGDTYAIMPAGDVDWYKIPRLATGDTLTVNVGIVGDTNINLNLWLYGPVEDPANITGNSFIAQGNNLNTGLPASGDYYLRIAETSVYPVGANPTHLRKNFGAETEREVRSDIGIYNLYASANYNYDYNTPLNLEATNQAGFVELNWVEPLYERYLSGYQVYRDGAVINDELVPIGTNLYHDAEVVVGTEYNYQVAGVYEDPYGVSLPSNTATVFYYNQGDPFWGDDFEGHPDFTIDLPNWIQHDVDGGATYSITDIEFANAGVPMSYIVFNPASTTPPIVDMIPNGGDKFLASFASAEGQNNDWIITPRIYVGATTVISFYARSYTSNYGLERFKVKMSLGGDQVENFTYSLHQDHEYIEASTEWTPYYFNVSALSGNIARFAIQCVSSDAFMLMIDDFKIDSTGDAVENEDVNILPQVNTLNQNYPNPFNPETSINFSLKGAGKVTLEIYNIRGQKVKTLLNEYTEAGQHSVVWNGTDDNNNNVSSGVYFYRLKNGKFNSTKKMILMK